jgi:hypothetical protein
MIGVFVGDDDAVEASDVTADRGEAPQRFFLAQSRVDQQPGLVRLEQSAIARTARSQYRYAQTDKIPPADLRMRAQAQGIMTNGKARVNRTNAF